MCGEGGEKAEGRGGRGGDGRERWDKEKQTGKTILLANHDVKYQEILF